MANCTGNCAVSATELLNLKIAVEVATFVRLSQVVQAFGGTPVVVLPDLGTPTCTSSELGLLASLLIQKQANFNMLQQVLLAV